MDVRSACIAIIQATAGDIRSQVISCRPLGAPVVVVLTPDAVEVWKQCGHGAEPVEKLVPDKAEAYFRKHKSQLAPEAVFRAKTWGRLDHQFQLSFVDAGLMPLIEGEIGQHLTDLIGRVYHGLHQSLWPEKSDISVDDGHWLIKAAFWLLAAKILRDKRVHNFITLDLLEVEDVFARVARHYDSNRAALPGLEIRTRRQLSALQEAAQEIAGFSHLGHVTTESLAHVYESALITPAVRKLFGTHSTPQYLVDYVVWKLRPWIEEIPEDDRHVFEPACGHSAFLVAAMRLLKELLSADKQADRKRYLRKHLHGVEIDSFAMEIARLSLTLADIPNANGWDLIRDDMFTNSLLVKGAQQASILLGNPPFENFSKKDRAKYAQAGAKYPLVNKTAEVLAQVLPQLSVGGVFGFVVPKGFLHSKSARDVRSLICHEFEIQEICLFSDKVFSFSDAESAVILGRRVAAPAPRHSLSYRRVREADMDQFRLDYEVTSRQTVPQSRICDTTNHDMLEPELCEVWDAMKGLPCLESMVDLGQGFQFQGRDLPSGAETVVDGQRRGVPGFIRFDARTIYSLPTEHKVIIDADVIRRPGTGLQTGISQVLLNYAPVSRGAWRLRALMDQQGHAVTSRFITVRSVEAPLEFLWALLNSPVANAYAFCHSTQRQTTAGVLRKMPIPPVSNTDMNRIAKLANKFRREATRQSLISGEFGGNPKAKKHLLALDAEILRLYDLSPKLERELLDFFAGHERKGLGFAFDRYFPEDFEPYIHLHEYLSGAFANSTAASLLKTHRTFDAPEISEALRRATEDFEE